MDQQEMVTKLKKLNSAIEDFLDRWEMDEADEDKSDEKKEEK
jgi:hypothetical protein